jgi:hypothetical protein
VQAKEVEERLAEKERKLKDNEARAQSAEERIKLGEQELKTPVHELLARLEAEKKARIWLKSRLSFASERRRSG